MQFFILALLALPLTSFAQRFEAEFNCKMDNGDTLVVDTGYGLKWYKPGSTKDIYLYGSGWNTNGPIDQYFFENQLAGTDSVRMSFGLWNDEKYDAVKGYQAAMIISTFNAKDERIMSKQIYGDCLRGPRRQ